MSRVDEAYSPIVLDAIDDVAYHAIRKRNSKKELFEFDVSAGWIKMDGRMGQRAASNERLAGRGMGDPGALGGVSQ